MRKRKDILQDLIHNKRNTSDLISELSKYPWDCEESLIVIKNEDICNILELYIDGNLSQSELENWANAIECREDQTFEDDSLEEIINKIANPVLHGISSISEITNIIKNIGCK